MGGPLAESAGERLVASAADGDLDDGSGTSRRTAALGVLVLVRLVRVGVGIVVVMMVVVVVVAVADHFLDAAGQHELAAGGGAAGAALAEELGVHPASLVLPEAVLERVLEPVEGEVLGAARVGPVQEGAMPPRAGTATPVAR